MFPVSLLPMSPVHTFDAAKDLLKAAGAKAINGQLAISLHHPHGLFMRDLITIDPTICNGRPVVKGTRITVQTVMEFLATGDTVEDVLEEHPALTRENVSACMEWAWGLMANHFQIAALA